MIDHKKSHPAIRFRKAGVLTLILTLFFICISATAQNSITGTVSDQTSILPVQDATVYINNTAIGTSTDLNGAFSLKNVTFPCKLIISRIGYELKTIDLAQFTPEKQIILLKAKAVQLSAVEISAKNNRGKSVDKFKRYFLGSDSWSKQIKLENNAVLEFESSTDTLQPDIANNYFQQINEENDTTKSKNSYNVFSVKAKAPIILDFPSFGYKLSVDLVNFNIVKTPKTSICKYLAYYFYQPYTSVSKTAERRYQKNRLTAFSNSREHFTRMLFNDKLRKSGYLVVDCYIDSATYEVEKKFFDINNHLVYKNDKEAQIIGLKGRTFYIFDFFNYNNKPYDLTNTKKFDFKSVDAFWKSSEKYRDNDLSIYNYKNSSITFTADTCTIKNNGTILDDNILFGGKMVQKKAAAMIPDIYIP